MTKLPIHYAELKTLYRQIMATEVKSIAVSSANGSAGVSMLSIALAERAALDGIQVLLIDANLAQPSLHNYVDVERTAWSADEEHWQHHICQHSENLFVLPATLNGADPSFHCQNKLKDAITQLNSTYGLIIFDTSPICKLNQNNIPPDTLCSAVDGCLFCVMTGVSLESHMLTMSTALSLAEVNILGAVMNDCHAPSLRDELIRETHRLDRFFPRVADKLRNFINHATLLNQDI